MYRHIYEVGCNINPVSRCKKTLSIKRLNDRQNELKTYMYSGNLFTSTINNSLFMQAVATNQKLTIRSGEEFTNQWTEDNSSMNHSSK